MKFTIKSSSVKNYLMLMLFCTLPTKALSQNTAGSTVTGAPPQSQLKLPRRGLTPLA